MRRYWNQLSSTKKALWLLVALLWIAPAAQQSPTPWNCQYAGRALGTSGIGLAASILTLNPIGFGIGSFSFYFAWMNWVKCQEANNQDPSRW